MTTIISPLVTEAPPDFRFSEDDFRALEDVGKLKLNSEHRRRLDDLAHFFLGRAITFRSPRPAVFRKRLDKIGKALVKTRRELDLNGVTASATERHLFNWVRNSGIEEAETFFKDHDELLKRMERMVALVSRAKEALPRDRGEPRPFDDQQLFISLADVFEGAGGDAVIYWNEHQDRAGVADTAFRAFVQEFYRRVPMRPRRTQSGVDEALRTAMKRRRARRKKG